jgi:hypothetical protein
MSAGDMQAQRAHKEQDRCIFCATDEEITAARRMGGVRALIERAVRRHPTIHWQGRSCPFEEA